MKILITGGSGVIGSRLLRAFISEGHEVVATTRHQDNVQFIEDRGARGVAVDAYDAPHLTAVVREAAPDVIVHQLTDLSDFDLEANARLRRAGTANLVLAARAVGVERIIAQSISWAYEPGDTPAVENDPLVADTAIAVMENHLRKMPRATVLRYGRFYGPGTWYAADGRIANAAAAGLLLATPAIASFIHIDDAVAATVQSVDWPDGAYNIVDDEPASAATWVPEFARGLGAPVPRPVPLPAGEPLGRGASNEKARQVGWVPKHPTWRDDFPNTVELW
ncbi:NAD(P)-dependent oxidoreductase [Microbacterium sp.]|uniref:NAD-dependent epimerase/dehydratase family protein n=1 Tax=Microbacterium sp. TaxID=51671 RepID=UPI0027357FC0|nr:NAD(P)-dependent oxidoreductase [Microbacterium sp.]MDP3951971.1 NAD(P)-dependent oxidoreductase [Microbacterium sp.]